MIPSSYRPDEVFSVYLEQAQNSFEAFIGGLIVPSSLGPMYLSRCMADHQRECFRDLAPNLEALRVGDLPPRRRWWLERTKKASKDTDIAACLIWLLAFPRRPIFLQVGAADLEQAGIIKRRIDDFVYYNPWLSDFIEISTRKLRSKDSLAVCDILAADVAGSHGATPDLLVCNELSHVTKWEFIQNLLDNADGVPRGMVIIATNAGIKGSDSHKLREDVLASPNWEPRIFDRPAPWISEEDLADAERRNPPSRFRRLWKGEWASGKGDAFDDSVIDRCIDDRRAPIVNPEPGWYYLAGLDLGVRHDHCGLVVVGANPSRPKLRLVYMRAFEPGGRAGEVDLMEVEEVVHQVNKHYRTHWCGYDPYQCALMAQRLRRRGIPMQEYPFIGQNLNRMATTMLEVLREGKLEAFDDEQGRLRKDLGKLSIIEKSYGYRLESVRDATGHADVAVALSIVLPKATEIQRGSMLLPDDDVGFDNIKDFSPEEIKELPQEFRELFEHYDEQDNERDYSF